MTSFKPNFENQTEEVYKTFANVLSECSQKHDWDIRAEIIALQAITAKLLADLSDDKARDYRWGMQCFEFILRKEMKDKGAEFEEKK